MEGHPLHGRYPRRPGRALAGGDAPALCAAPAPSVAATNAIDVEQAWTGWPAYRADPDAVNAVLAAVAGDFVYQSMLPAPENLPTPRAHQREEGAAALGWLRRRIS